MKDLMERAKQLADDIDEYAPDTNIALMIRELMAEIVLLKRELTKAKGKK
jgi:hypothetical protein